MPMNPLRAQLAAVAAIVVAGDVLTKQVALASLPAAGMPVEVLGEVVRFTLAFNKGAAFGMHVGGWSRVIFSLIAFGMVGALWVIAGRLQAPATRMVIAMGLVCGGALGNLLDRLRWDRGVVDFIDIGMDAWRFWTFNLADSAITVGAILLLLPASESPPARVASPAAPPAPPAGDSSGQAA
ncbi:MAG: signal peptidase II [Gemmatimonadetes bacterium]|nr:signal peptidase II [Gemmatimonadota bacterium]